MGYVIVKLYETREWALSDVAEKDYPAENPWSCDDRGAFRYVRIPRSMWNDIEDLRRRRQADGYLPPLLEDAELLIHRLAQVLLNRPGE